MRIDILKKRARMLKKLPKVTEKDLVFPLQEKYQKQFRETKELLTDKQKALLIESKISLEEILKITDWQYLGDYCLTKYEANRLLRKVFKGSFNRGAEFTYIYAGSVARVKNIEEGKRGKK